MTEEAFVFPPSFAQQRLWFLDQLLPANPFYNIPAALRLQTPLSVGAFERSLNEVVRRHESLRTTFATDGGQPVQVVAAELWLKLEVTDLRHLPAAEREAEAVRLATAEAQRPFDLSTGPLVRAGLLKLGEADFVFLLTMHHIVTDGWSMGVFFRELTALYGAYAVGRPSPLPELPIQYADYSVWQREWLQGEVLEQQLSYWEGRLRGLPRLQLPTDRPRPPVQSFRGAQHRVEIAPPLAAELRRLSRREGATLFMTLLAAFKILLSRYSGQEDIVVGTPIAGRNRAELEPLIGFFVNTLVLRTRLDGGRSFREALQRVREACLEAYAHQEVPFEMLVERLQPERDLSRNPLFQVTFQLLNSTGLTPQPTGQASPVLEVSRATAIFDMAFNLWESGDGVGGQIEYNTDLFEADTINRLARHFHSLLESAAADPDRPVAQLPMLSEGEREELLVEWNQTAAEYPRRACVHELFEAQAARTPDAVALVFDGRQVSYAELDRRANQLARYLRGRGVAVETLVGVMVGRSAEMVVSLLGVLKAGGAYVPLDAEYPAERLRYMVEDAGVRVVVTQAALAGRLGAGQAGELVIIDGQWDEIGRESGEPVESGAGAENLAYVMYTSGSTGRPKGILIPHRGLVNYLTWCIQAYEVEAGEGAPVHSSISFDLTVTSLFSPLLAGRKVHLLPEDIGIETLAAALQDGVEFSLVKITPAHLELLSRQMPPQRAAGRVRAFIIGGENLLAEQIAFWRTHAPQMTLVNEYGPTECVVGCCVYKVPHGKHTSGSIPIGRPIANTEIYILDSQLQPAPVGVAGQLLIGGAGLARGYLNRPELTAEKFIPHPFSLEAGARLYQTGDLARRLADGSIEFLGRVDQQVKVRGYRVELGEIESVLRQHADVQEAVVMAREEAGGGKRLVAYVVAAEVGGVTAGDLRAHLRERLPEYMVPASYVMLERLPLTPNGKADRDALPEPDAARPQLEVSYVAPRTPVEEVLAAIWAEVLGIEQIGVHDNFFTELGGHSLLATQLISRVRDTFKVELPLRRLFETPTIDGLAEGLLQMPGQRASVEKTAELLLMLQELSDDDVEVMLSEKTSLATEEGAK